jgi:hypothetical protein
MNLEHTLGTRVATQANTKMGLRVLITMIILGLLILVAPLFQSADHVQAQANVDASTIAPSFESFLR